MKKFIYFCAVILFGMNAFAQFDPDDRNWMPVIDDDFSGITWQTWNEWIIADENTKYQTYMAEWPSGVTRDTLTHMVNQRENIVFGDSCGINIVSHYVGGDNLTSLYCGDYDLPPGKNCDTSHRSLYYTSGNIETQNKDGHFGYYELTCCLPTHQGAKNAFWLYGCTNGTYGEIDIFEHGRYDSSGDQHRGYSCGIWYNPDGTNYHIIDSLHGPAHNYAKEYLTIPSSSTDLDYLHTYGCEWMPDRITWFFDGEKVNECTETDFIPKNTMVLKISYSINDSFILDPNNIWMGSDTLSVARLCYYKLSCDCDDDVTIRSQSDIDTFPYSVKKSITIDSEDEIVVGSSDKVTFRATDSFVVSGPFLVNCGGELTVIIQDCPE